MSMKEDVMELITNSPGMTDRDLSETLRKKNQEINKTCHDLEKAGYLIRKISRERDRLIRNYPTEKPFVSGRTYTYAKLETNQIPKEIPNVEQGIILLGGLTFNYVQDLIPLTDKYGNIICYQPQERYNNLKKLSLNAEGEGFFCKFHIDSKWNYHSGVYAYIINNIPVYIGRTNNLGSRFNYGYGSIQPRNCFKGGQITNCKVNKLVLQVYESGGKIQLYFHSTSNYNTIEHQLIAEYNPPYNEQR